MEKLARLNIQPFALSIEFFFRCALLSLSWPLSIRPRLYIAALLTAAFCKLAARSCVVVDVVEPKFYASESVIVGLPPARACFPF